MRGSGDSFFHPATRSDADGIPGTEVTGPSSARGKLNDAARGLLAAGSPKAFQPSLADAAEFK